MYEWTDPDTGTVWQMYYDVPQGGDERESVRYRIKGMNVWSELPPFARAPKEAEALWFGEVKQTNLLELWKDIGKHYAGDARAWAFVNFLINELPYEPKEEREQESTPCTCTFYDDGDGESGPHLHMDADRSCPTHGVKADPDAWLDNDPGGFSD